MFHMDFVSNYLRLCIFKTILRCNRHIYNITTKGYLLYLLYMLSKVPSKRCLQSVRAIFY